MKKPPPERIAELQLKTWRILAGLDDSTETYPNWLGHSGKNARIDFALLRGETRENLRKDPPYRKNRGTDSHIYYLIKVLELPVDYAGCEIWRFNKRKLEDLLSQKGIDFSGEAEADDSTEASDTDEPPATIESTIRRVIRDTAVSRAVKVENEYKCAWCDFELRFANGKSYIEGHHIVPLGKEHKGLDIESNIICACPNHHAMLDYALLRIDEADFKNPPKHKIRREFIEYHNSVIRK